MKPDTFTIETDHKGHRYIYQTLDEIDKNHNADDDDPMNRGRIYETSGNLS